LVEAEEGGVAAGNGSLFSGIGACASAFSTAADAQNSARRIIALKLVCRIVEAFTVFRFSPVYQRVRAVSSLQIGGKLDRATGPV
jgi:hypothetical protein